MHALQLDDGFLADPVLRAASALSLIPDVWTSAPSLFGRWQGSPVVLLGFLNEPCPGRTLCQAIGMVSHPCAFN